MERLQQYMESTLEPSRRFANESDFQAQLDIRPQAANLMFMLVARRYERASLVVTSNKRVSAWGV